MTFDTALFGQKLAARREALGLSSSDLADAAGIASERVAELERGRTEPTGDEVLIIADVLRVDFRFFVSADVAAPDDNLDTLFRRYGDRVRPADRRAIADLLYLCETEHLCQSALGRTSTLPLFRFRKAGTHYKTHGVEAAKALRSHLSIQPNVAIDDVFARARQLGVHVFRRRLPDKAISGLTVRHRSAGSCVVTATQRRTLASAAHHHEACHTCSTARSALLRS